ncbi:MAG: exo-alpha-sialidase [Rhodospirillaceae bacterium]|nr:exo-alpha-sialidase [Rhodospirillaceae bacterium]
MALKKVLLGLLAALVLGALAHAEPVSPTSHVAVAPDVAVNAKGEIALMWVDRAPEQQKKADGPHDNHLSSTDLYVAMSRDGGATFTAPVKVNQADGVVWGQQVSRPRIVSSNKGNWHIAYAANEVHPALNKVALTTHYTRSTDGGANFEPPKRLSTLTDKDLSHMIHGGFISAAAFATLAAAPDGSVHVVWIDTRNMGSERDTGAMYAATSRDDGKTFAPDRELMATGVCPCCQLVAVSDAASNILLGSRQVSGDNIRQSTVMRIAASSGMADTAVVTGGAPWQIAGCPLKPTVMAVKDGNIYTAAYNGGEAKPGVYFSMSADAGASYTKAALAHPEAAVSDAPSIATNGRYVLLAWHGKTTGARRVFYRMYNLKGEPAGSIAELAAGPENAQNPIVAARPDGKFQIAWQQADRIHTTTLPGAPGQVVRN